MPDLLKTLGDPNTWIGVAVTLGLRELAAALLRMRAQFVVEQARKTASPDDDLKAASEAMVLENIAKTIERVPFFGKKPKL